MHNGGGYLLDFTFRVMKRFSGGMVLAFHEIAPSRLAEFVDCLRPSQVVSLTELVQRTKAGKSTSGLLAITIDDGVGENVRALTRLFLACEWPATFYLPTDYLDIAEGMPFQWWRRLKPHLPHRKLDLKSGSLDFSAPGAVEKFANKLEILWHSQRRESYVPQIMELVEIVASEGAVSRALLQPDAPISWSEVEQLSKTDLIRFESHGVTHTAMCALTDDEIVCEMKRSRDIVAERSGRPCRHLAYPFGSPLSIGTRAPAAAARYYDSAVTMTLGSVDRANPFSLPRIPLYTENSILRARLKILLKSIPSNRFRRTVPVELAGAAAGARSSQAGQATGIS